MKILLTICIICVSLVLAAGQQWIRDQRQNRGPVVFPAPPPDAIEESSGVIVGASGYGFVPPQTGRLNG